MRVEAAGVEDLIEKSTGAGDAEATKPDPDLVHAAIERSRLPPEALVMLGDTPYDVAAAKRAGTKTIEVLAPR